MHGTAPFDELGVGFLELATHAVLHLIARLVNVPARFASLPKFLRGGFMRGVAGLDEVGVRKIQRFLERVKLAAYSST